MTQEKTTLDTTENNWTKIEPPASNINELKKLVNQSKFLEVSENNKIILIKSRYALSESGAIQDAKITSLKILGQYSPSQEYEIKKFIYDISNNTFDDVTNKTSYIIPEDSKILYQATIKDSVKYYIKNEQ